MFAILTRILWIQAKNSKRIEFEVLEHLPYQASRLNFFHAQLNLAWNFNGS